MGQQVENLSAHLSPDTVDVDGKSNHIKGTVSIMHDKYSSFLVYMLRSDNKELVKT